MLSSMPIGQADMVSEQLKAFVLALEGDGPLRERVVGAADLDAVVEIGQDAGFAITKAEVENLQQMFEREDLSEEELAAVNGGGFFAIFWALTTVAPAFAMK
jgi:predicted ribosomally synthesized peptide with nif11-like leader